MKRVKILERKQLKAGIQTCTCGKEMSDCLIHPSIKTEWIASMQASLVRILVRLENRQDLVRVHVQDFTEKSCELLAHYEPSTSSWKTWQQSLITDSALSLQTYPRWGMTVDGVLYQHPMSGLTIRESGGGASASYGTPRATQTGRAALRGSSGNLWVQKKLELEEVSEEEAYVMIGQKSPAMLGTPTASMWRGINHKRGMSGEHRGNLNNQIAHQEYTKLGLNTDKKQAVMQMLPTPRSFGAMSATITPEKVWSERRMKFNNLEEAIGRILYENPNQKKVMAMLPTPMAQDTIPKNNPAYVQRRKELGLPITLQMQIGGLLNPTFVEWMMGFPINYTKTKLKQDSLDLVTRKYLLPQQWRGKFSLKI